MHQRGAYSQGAGYERVLPRMASEPRKDTNMSLMETISKPADRPLLVTICGDSGLGKTTLAASFPRPIFIRAEDGMQAIPQANRPDAFPVVQSVNDLWAQLKAVIHEPHEYQTLVIDSVTALERLFGEEVLRLDGKARSLNQALGGYGAGFAAVGAMHRRVAKAAQLCVERRGMHVVFVAHADTETIRSPDVDDYMRYSLRLNQKYSLAPYVDDVDIVGFLRLETFVRGEEGDRKIAISSGDRELVVHATATAVSKNRFGITDPLPVVAGENPLAGLVPGIQARDAAQDAAPAERRRVRKRAESHDEDDARSDVNSDNQSNPEIEDELQ